MTHYPSMWVDIRVPQFGDRATATISRLFCEADAPLAAGTPLMDLEVDLSAGITRDCPPISTCRIFVREALWLRRLPVGIGALLSPGAVIAELSTTPLEKETAIERSARITAAAIVVHPDWWSEER